MPEMTILEAAARLGVSENAVRKRIRRGSIEARKDGERWVVTIDENDQVFGSDEPGRGEDDADRDLLLDQLFREIEFLQGQIAAKDRVIDLLLGRSSEATTELSGHLRHVIDGMLGSRMTTEDPAR